MEAKAKVQTEISYDEWVIRRATLDDADLVAETVALAFEGYRAWAPPGWDPPLAPMHLERANELLSLSGAWCAIAFEDDAVAGHVAFSPARTREEPHEPIADLAYLSMLFVREPWWGTGLATELLRRATTEAAAQGYRSMRLETPLANARARRFYEREGWRLAGDAIYEPTLGFEIIEYRRPLG
jgi:GNAT superfamily N-acetyltransferase